MLKKSLIGLIVVALAGGYWYYDDYQKKERARLIKERNESISRMLKDAREEERNRAKNSQKEAKDRQERIKSGTAKTEEVIMYYPNTKQIQEQYTLVDGKKEGLEVIWYENGQKKSEKHYKDGKGYGAYHSWYKNGQDSLIATYNNNCWDKEYLDYYDNPKNTLQRKAFYKNCKEEGEVISWHPDGKLKTKSFYSQENPKLNAGKSWRKDGTLTSESYYDQERDTFIKRLWYGNGVLKQESENNARGHFHGKVTTWYENGNKENEQYYKNGLIDGTCQKWDEQGKLIAQDISILGRVLPHEDNFGDCK